ncbi:MAG TPA: SDR family oxidoreductase [Nakamurella sp.]
MGLDYDNLTGRTALVTGASSGIGSKFARELAGRGCDLVLTARSRAKLAELADDLQREHGVRVVVIDHDLAGPGSAQHLLDELNRRDLLIDILINNAGFGMHGDVVDADADRIDAMTSLNVGSLVALASRLMPGMVQRRAGAIVNVASTAAYQPVPHMAAYGATKSFVLSFSRALWAENRTTGVDVLALSPGATETEFFRIAGEDAAVGRRRSTAQVVRTALRALAQGRPSVVDGHRNALLAWISPRTPERLMLAIVERSIRPSGRGPAAMAVSAASAHRGVVEGQE